MSLYIGSNDPIARRGPEAGGGRKGAASHLSKMHQMHEANASVAAAMQENKGAGLRHLDHDGADVKRRKNAQARRGGMQEGLRRRQNENDVVMNPGGIRRVQEVDEGKHKPQAVAWIPSGYAQSGHPAIPKNEFKPGQAARGPHYGYRRDYHRYRAHEEDLVLGAVDPSEARARPALLPVRAREDGGAPEGGMQDKRHYKIKAAVEPALGVGLQGGKLVGVRPFIGIHGVQADRLDAWAMKKPHGGDPMIPDYPKRLVGHGPADTPPRGHARVGPDRVGPVAEFRERRVDRRGHARGHAHVDVERVGIFPKHGPPPQLVAERLAGAAPVDPEDASRAVPAVLNGTRLRAVRRAWGELDRDRTGSVRIDELISRLQYMRHRKRMDFFRRDDVVVAMDDLVQQLSQTLVSVMQAEARDVRISSAFMPSSCAYASRVGHVSGKIKLKEFERVYERIGCMVHDDAFFEELVEEAWGVGPASADP